MAFCAFGAIALVGAWALLSQHGSTRTSASSAQETLPKNEKNSPAGPEAEKASTQKSAVDDGVAPPLPKETGVPLRKAVVATAQPGKSDAPPKPASTPQFDTPLGYFAGVVRSRKTTIQARFPESLEEAADHPVDKKGLRCIYGHFDVEPDSCFIYLHFYAPKGGNPRFAFGQFSIRAGEQAGRLQAFCTGLMDDVVEAVGPNVSSFKDLPGSTYLVFTAPKSARTCDLAFGGRSLTVDLSNAHSMENETATPGKATVSSGNESSLFTLFKRKSGTSGRLEKEPPADLFDRLAKIAEKPMTREQIEGLLGAWPAVSRITKGMPPPTYELDTDFAQQVIGIMDRHLQDQARLVEASAAAKQAVGKTGLTARTYLETMQVLIFGAGFLKPSAVAEAQGMVLMLGLSDDPKVKGLVVVFRGILRVNGKIPPQSREAIKALSPQIEAAGKEGAFQPNP